MKVLLAALLLAAATGCASTRHFAERHPVATSIGLSTLVTGIALSTRGHRQSGQDDALRIGEAPLPCRSQPDGSCR